MHKSGLELGDEQASGISLDVWALATGGKVPEEILAQEVERERRMPRPRPRSCWPKACS